MLACHIVNDLLSNQAEGLNGPETAADVEEHLQSCDDCRATYTQLQQPISAQKAAKQEIKPLKKLKRRTVKAILITACSLLTLFAAIVLACFVGFSVSGDEMKWNVVTTMPPGGFDSYLFPGDVFTDSNGKLVAKFEYQPENFAACGLELFRPGKRSMRFWTEDGDVAVDENDKITGWETTIRMRKILNPFDINGAPKFSCGIPDSGRYTFILDFSDKDVALVFEDGKLVDAQTR